MNLIVRMILVVTLPVVLFGCSSSDITEGRAFKTEAEFKKAVSSANYLIIGSFNLGWPATIESVEDGENQITLKIPDFGTNEYPGLDGYKLKAVLLMRDDGKHSGFVLRAKDKS